MVTVKAYAKLNLVLAVTGVLPNGMHALDMVMQTISLHDELEIRKAERTFVHCQNTWLPEENTLAQAAKLFFAHTGIRGGAHVGIVKHIPHQAGLGGGSSDGAAMLCALNHLYGASLSDAELRALALQIGADVPFFIHGGCARAQGVGEILTPIQNNCSFGYLLVKPQKGVNTGEAYRLFDSVDQPTVDVQSAVDALSHGDAPAYFRAAKNALAPAGIALCGEIGQVIARCYDLGAQFAMMTGSGSCVFAVFDSPDAQKKAQDALSPSYPFCAAAQNIQPGQPNI